jgi:hypothetical protein
LQLQTTDAPQVSAYGADGKPIVSASRRTDNSWYITASTPITHPTGGLIRFQIQGNNVPITVTGAKIEFQPIDRDGNGVADSIERWVGVKQLGSMRATPVSAKPSTWFQTGRPWSPDIASPTDGVFVFSTDAAVLQSWSDHGYRVRAMFGLRDGAEYVQQHPGDVQIDRDGKPISIGGSSYYLVPTPTRAGILTQNAKKAIEAGAEGICIEEPEYWARAGYSPAFRDRWQSVYGSPWQSPDSSVDARLKAGRLMSDMQADMLANVFGTVNTDHANAIRTAALHSPLNYAQWGIVSPHTQLMRSPLVQEFIGQVWSGTAKTQERASGVRQERVFETAFLEYSSLTNLVRGLGKRLWLLNDPLEDDPALTMEAYRKNWEATVTASLMFPEADGFEAMPWPERIFGRAPKDYQSVINTMTGIMSDLWRNPSLDLESGTSGIAIAYSDSMQWQREAPTQDHLGGFFGLALTLVNRGIPIAPICLERFADPGYLEKYKIIMLSYDYMKPADASVHTALADWVQRGGSLIVFRGGDNAEDVPSSWWRNGDVRTPVDDLFAKLGVSSRTRTPQTRPGPRSASLPIVLSNDSATTGATPRRTETIDLTEAAKSGSAIVRFEDVSLADGLGANVSTVELRFDDRLAASFRAGSEIETRFLVEDFGSRFDGEGRYADHNAYWVYAFENLPRNSRVTLTLEISNGYRVRAGSGLGGWTSLRLEKDVAAKLDEVNRKLMARVRLPAFSTTSTTPMPSGAAPVATVNGDSAPTVWKQTIGRGQLVYCGIGSEAFSATAQTGKWIRTLVRWTCEQLGFEYKESKSYIQKRGPYIVAKALGSDLSLDGPLVDLFDPNLPLIEEPEVAAGSARVFFAPKSLKGLPNLLVAAGRINARYEVNQTTAFIVSAPQGEAGVARVWAGKHKLAGVKACDFYGNPVSITSRVDGETIRLNYSNDPHGVTVLLSWR